MAYNHAGTTDKMRESDIRAIVGKLVYAYEHRNDMDRYFDGLATAFGAFTHINPVALGMALNDAIHHPAEKRVDRLIESLSLAEIFPVLKR